jgi:hypothetical protein
MADFADPNPVGKTIMVGTTPLEYTAPAMSKRKAIRAQVNPMDRCTLVSIFPKEINEEKVTLYPGKFKIPAGTFENPAVLTIGSSSWWKDYDFEQPLLEIVNSSIQIADSIIKDYCNGMLGFSGESMPGLFFVLGEHTTFDIKTKYRAKLEEMKDKQNNWYHVLVKLADSLWARTAGNPLAIWDEMRLAARSLNLNEKPWLKDYYLIEKIPCKACGTLKNPSYPVCQVCKAVDLSHPDAKDLKFSV